MRHIRQSRALMPIFAQVSLGRDDELHLDSAQVRAVVDATVNGRLLRLTSISRVLALSGVTGKMRIPPTLDDCLKAARRLRRSLPAFGDVGEVSEDACLTVLEAILLAVQVHDREVPFAISRQAALNAYVKALLADKTHSN